MIINEFQWFSKSYSMNGFNVFSNRYFKPPFSSKNVSKLKRSFQIDNVSKLYFEVEFYLGGYDWTSSWVYYVISDQF